MTILVAEWSLCWTLVNFCSIVLALHCWIATNQVVQWFLKWSCLHLVVHVAIGKSWLNTFELFVPSDLYDICMVHVAVDYRSLRLSR